MKKAVLEAIFFSLFAVTAMTFFQESNASLHVKANHSNATITLSQTVEFTVEANEHCNFTWYCDGVAAQSEWATSSNYTFIPKAFGTYEVQLAINGMILPGPADSVTVRVIAEPDQSTTQTPPTCNIHQNQTLLTIQSPKSNSSYREHKVPLIINLTLIYGTTTTLDEFSPEKPTCSYSLDNGEWRKITSVNVTSNASQPDINYWNGLPHKLNLTFSTTLEGLSEGLHTLNISLTSVDSWGPHQNFSQTYFTIETHTEPPPETFPTLLVFVTSVGITAVGIGLIAYFKKHSNQQRRQVWESFSLLHC